MKYDELNGKNVIYRGAALLPGKPAAAFWSVLGLIAVCALLFRLASLLPYSAFLKIAVLVIMAVGLNYLLKRGTFSVTYALTDDGELIYITKYGRLEWESAWIFLDRAEIQDKKIIFEKRKYDFYPDESLRELINGVVH